MGQTISSDYLELYYQVPAKPTPKHFDSLDISTIKHLRMFTLQQIENNFDSIDKTKCIKQSNNFGTFYGEKIKNGKREGLGIQHYGKEHIVYLGNFHNNKIDGMGIAIFNDNSWFYGEWNEGQCFGDMGLLYTKDGDIYCGQWKDRIITCGYLKKYNYEYFGSFKSGLRDGLGVCFYFDGTSYRGKWSDDQMHELGLLKSHNNSSYFGHFRYNLRQGFGLNKNKMVEQLGQFHLDKPHGLIEQITIQNQEVIQGLFMYGELDGLYCQFKHQVQNQKEWYHKTKRQITHLDKVQRNDPLEKQFGAEWTFADKRKELLNQQKQIENETDRVMQENQKYYDLCKKDLEKVKSWQSIFEYQKWVEQNPEVK